MGSSLTYARRYNWAAMCGVGSEEDDDAREAEREKPPQKPGEGAQEKRRRGARAFARQVPTKAELEALYKTHFDRIEGLPDSLAK